jgi:hypothetical protein
MNRASNPSVFQTTPGNARSMQCSACGAAADAACDCGAPYLPAGDRAAKAVAANPQMSDRAIAAEIGVHSETVRRARQSTASNAAVGPRTGRDGKTRAMPKPAAVDVKKVVGAFHHELTDTLNDYCARLETFLEANPNLDEECLGCLVQVLELNSMRLQQLAQQIDGRDGGSDQATEHDEIRREAAAQIDPPLSLTAQQRLAGAIRKHQRKLEAEFEWRVRDDIKRRVEEMVLPSFRESTADAVLVIGARKGVFKHTEYNALLRCVHPDVQPTIEQKNEAFRLLHENRLVLLSKKEETHPKTYAPLPTDEEFMRGYPWKTKTKA